MDLKDLIARGALVSTPPTPREITWTPSGESEPVTFTVYVRAPSSGWLDRARVAAARAGDDRLSYQSAIISHAILFGDDQTEHFTYEQAEMLAPALADALMAAYHAVNTIPPRPAPDADKQEDFSKNTEPTPGSGTNSSKPASAAEASQPLASH
jgi:hypothetical protein